MPGQAPELSLEDYTAGDVQARAAFSASAAEEKEEKENGESK